MTHDDELDRLDQPVDGPTPPADASSSETVTPELLSAYLEDPAELSFEDLSRVEAALESDPESRRTLAELDVLTTELRALPRLQTQRSFHLSPADVGNTDAPTSAAAPEPFALRYLEQIRWVAAAAAMLFVVVLTADIVSNSVLSGPDDASDTAIESSGGGGAVADTAIQQETEAGPQLESGAAEAAETEAATEAEAAGESEESAQVPMLATTEPEATLRTGEAATAAEDGDESAGSASDAGLTPTPESFAFEATVEPTPEEALIAPAAEEIVEDEADSDGRSLWRAAEFGLIVLIALLLALIIIVPRYYRTRRS